MSNKNSRALLLLLLTGFVALTGCNKKERLSNESQLPNVVSVEEAQKSFTDYFHKQAQTELQTSNLSIAPNWDAHTTVHLSSKFSLLKVPQIQGGRTFGNNGKCYWYRDIIFQKQNDKVNAVAFEIRMDTAYFNKQIAKLGPGLDIRSYVDNKNFSGYILFFTLDNVFITGRKYTAGKMTYSLFPPAKDKRAAQTEDVICDYNDPVVGIRCWNEETGVTGVDLPGIVVTAPYTGPVILPGSSDPLAPVYNPAYDPNLIHNEGGGTGTSSPTATPPKSPAIIDDSKLKDCMKEVLASLKWQSKGVSSIIQQFAGEGDRLGFNWNVKNGPLGPDENGSTEPLYDRANNTVNTTIDDSKYKNATTFVVARTLLHEAVHAYIVTRFGTNPITANQTYGDLVEYYNRTQDANGAHHMTMATFVSSIADALQGFGELNGIITDRQFYEDMAWGGLTSTQAFKSLPIATQNRINNVLSVEQNGVDMNGAAKQQRGKKSGC
ncbi:hypothetical protein [Chitinophaga varians]|uniref:hypothetical protein n=1 Tax=Chitinophaga varians TaxID=2202339 RepID=UPI00165F6E8B|nr:hypothetical protein [Chitinophaga varians]MBC9912757.1 hypothetical protein [Chitinophaga varians]